MRPFLIAAVLLCIAFSAHAGVLSASGSTQSTAAAITDADTVVTSGSSTAFCIILPSVYNTRLVVHNRSGVTLEVFPNSGQQIENGGTNTPASLPSGSDATYIYINGAWYS
jgi:hypothetical protein